MNLTDEDRALLRCALDIAAMSVSKCSLAERFAELHDRIPAYPLPCQDITAEASAEMRRESVAESEAARGDDLRLLADKIAWRLNDSWLLMPRDRPRLVGQLGMRISPLEDAICVIESVLREHAVEVGR